MFRNRRNVLIIYIRFIWKTDNCLRKPYSCFSHSKRNTNSSYESFVAINEDESLTSVLFLPGSVYILFYLIVNR